MSWVLLSFLITAMAPFQEATPTVCREGFVHYQNNDYQDAETLLQACKEEAPGLIQPYLLLCSIYQRNGQQEELLMTALEGLQSFPEEQRFYQTAGVLSGRQGNYGKAVEVFEQAVERWPHEPGIRRNLVQASLALGLERLDQGQHEEAVGSLRRVVELDAHQLDAWINLGRALHNLKRSTEALKAFDKAARLDSSGQLQLSFQRGVVLYDLGRFEGAIEAFDEELKSSKHPPAYFFRGLSFIMLGEWQRALEDLNRASDLMGDDLELLLARARCLRRLGALEQAEQLVRRALQINAEDPRLHHLLGRILIETGQTADGEQSLERAKILNDHRRSVRPGEIRFQAYRRAP